jgi:Xaa-Pro aminopeptidase
MSGTSARPPCITRSYSDWLEPDHCLAGVVGMRGTIPPEFGLMKKYAKRSRS